MPENKVHLRIITPQEIKVDEDADMVIMRSITGDMGILFGHEACSTVLDYGVLRILDGDREQRLAVLGGLADVQDNVVTVLTSMAERPEDIDRAVAEEDRERAQLRLLESIDEAEMQSDQVTLRRALVRIEVSSYPLITNAEEEN